MLKSIEKNIHCLLIALLFCCSSWNANAQDPCFLIDVGEDVQLDVGETYGLSVVVSVPLNAIDHVLWTPSTGLSCSDCFDPSVQALEEICYTVSVTDTASCVISDTVCVFLFNTTSVIDLDVSKTVELFPNPLSDLLQIKSDSHPILGITIFDRNGRRIQSIRPRNALQELVDLTALPAGLYLANIQLNHALVRKRFIKH